MKSKDFQSLCDKYKTKIFYTASYYPRADHTERTNRVVKTMLRSYVQQDNHRSWEDNLPAIGCAIRTARHEVTGYSPYFVNFGREHVLFGSDFVPRVPSAGTEPQHHVQSRIQGYRDMYEQVNRRIASARSNYKNRYNLRRRPITYVVGQRVWRKNKVLSNALNFFSAKLAPEFVGPFTIGKKTGTCTYELQDESGISKGVWHVQDLKPMYSDRSGFDADVASGRS
ncbi:hypothetical protein YQE_00057, partial [Dendroctonus ponderosae]